MMTLKKKFEPLSLAHLDILNSFWKPLCIKNQLYYAEYSVANTFLFRKKHNYQFASGEYPLIKGDFSDSQTYYIPTCSPQDCHPDKIQKGMNESFTFFPIPESWLEEFKGMDTRISSFRQDSDYLFTKSKLIEMKGHALSSRRNLIHQFESHYSIEVKDLTPALIPEALKVLEAWQINSKQPPELTDFSSCLDAFKYMEKLNLIGRIVFADGVPVGFYIGELLTPQTALLHLMKTLHSYKGVTPFLYQNFATHLPDTVEWVNLEQDLGISSLRKAKEAYEPDRLVVKYRVTF